VQQFIKVSRIRITVFANTLLLLAAFLRCAGFRRIARSTAAEYLLRLPDFHSTRRCSTTPQLRVDWFSRLRDSTSLTGM